MEEIARKRPKEPENDQNLRFSSIRQRTANIETHRINNNQKSNKRKAGKNSKRTKLQMNAQYLVTS